MGVYRLIISFLVSFCFLSSSIVFGHSVEKKESLYIPYWLPSNLGPEVELSEFNVVLVAFKRDTASLKEEVALVSNALLFLSEMETSESQELISSLKKGPKVKIVLNDEGAHLASLTSPILTIDLNNRPRFVNLINNEVVEASIERVLGHELSHIVLNKDDVDHHDYTIVDVSAAEARSSVAFMDAILEESLGTKRGDHSNIVPGQFISR